LLLLLAQVERAAIWTGRIVFATCWRLEQTGLGALASFIDTARADASKLAASLTASLSRWHRSTYRRPHGLGAATIAMRATPIT
jgi:hypothetical protein